MSRPSGLKHGAECIVAWCTSKHLVGPHRLRCGYHQWEWEHPVDLRPARGLQNASEEPKEEE